MAFATQVRLDVPRALAEGFFLNPEAWLRLNPEWEVRFLDRDARIAAVTSFGFAVRYDRSDAEANYQVMVEEGSTKDRFTLTLAGESPRRMRVTLTGTAESVLQLSYEELGEASLEARQQTELALWLKSTADYLGIASRKAPHWRLLRWLLDKVWLGLSPSGRRLVILILVFEFAGLLLLLALMAVKALI